MQDEYFIVPNIVGMTLSQAIITLDKQCISYEIAGDGAVVLSQFPSAGTKVSKGSFITINTN